MTLEDAAIDKLAETIGSACQLAVLSIRGLPMRRRIIFVCKLASSLREMADAFDDVGELDELGAP